MAHPTTTSEPPRGDWDNGTFLGDDSYPVFPHARYISKFLLVNALDSGITHLDTDLYNFCYLPWNPLSYIPGSSKAKRKRDGSGTTTAGASKTSPTPKPTYLFDKAPCRRAASINSNCYLQNTNGTFSGLQAYNSSFDEQQRCYCQIYPYWDTILGCNECFRQHGGIEGYHWFPESYMSAASSTYCNANPITTGMFPFLSQWAKTDPIANIPTSTAPNVLGTETAMSLYWTYATTIRGAASTSNPNAGRKAASINSLGVCLSAAAAITLTMLAAF
ncbi:hypothetical protein Dda_8717 [Drechslerella dactyloides]|uniref:Uncharacterized protein n=1 Tax=Drechslerella dactyloides TaxID=74499 RepID=A0AAD6IQS8_DREDA|nr:hypothetical protein Dda_8717 [Drechslerella dactyloides]